MWKLARFESQFASLWNEPQNTPVPSSKIKLLISSLDAHMHTAWYRDILPNTLLSVARQHFKENFHYQEYDVTPPHAWDLYWLFPATLMYSKSIYKAKHLNLCYFHFSIFMITWMPTMRDCRDLHLFMLTHWGRDNTAAILQMTLSNAFSCMKILEFR